LTRVERGNSQIRQELLLAPSEDRARIVQQILDRYGVPESVEYGKFMPPSIPVRGSQGWSMIDVLIQIYKQIFAFLLVRQEVGLLSDHAPLSPSQSH
jgi:hypothetical protein